MPTITTIRSLIAEHMRRAWLDEDPGPDCFDASEANMDRLMRFMEPAIGRFLTHHEDAEAARRHLLTCSRCRYLYSRMREE